MSPVEQQHISESVLTEDSELEGLKENNDIISEV